MREILKRLTTVALAAVLVFMTVVPVPTGNSYVDGLTHEKASANPAAIAVPVIAATVLAAAGVYVAGTTYIEYEGNRTTVANAFVSFIAENFYHDDIDAAAEALQSAVNNDGNIDFGVLAQLGIIGAIPLFAAALIESEAAGVAESSILVTDGQVTIGSHTYTVTTLPEEISNLPEMQAYNQYVYAYAKIHHATDAQYGRVAKYQVYTYKYSGSKDIAFMGSNTYQEQGNSGSGSSIISIIFNQDATYSFGDRSGAQTVTIGSANNYGQVYDYVNLIQGFPLRIGSSELVVEQSGNFAATVSQGVLDSTKVAPNEGIYEPFEPTAEQLEAGYDSTAVIEAQIGEINGNIADVIARINAQTQAISGINVRLGEIANSASETKSGVQSISATLEGIPAFLQGLLDAVLPLHPDLQAILLAMNPLTNILNGITSIANVVTGVQASPFTWLQTWWGTLSGWWSGLLDWLGDTPFGAVVGGAVGTLGGILDDILAGLRAGVGTLEGVVVGVGDAVLSIPASIASTLDGILAAERAPIYTPSSSGLQIQPELKAQLEAALDMKAPFCYMRRMQALASSIAGNFGGSATFYFDIEMPYAGTQRFDAGELLNQEWGNRTLAEYIRILLTASICAGLLAISLKLAIGRINAKE